MFGFLNLSLYLMSLDLTKFHAFQVTAFIYSALPHSLNSFVAVLQENAAMAGLVGAMSGLYCLLGLVHALHSPTNITRR